MNTLKSRYLNYFAFAGARVKGADYYYITSEGEMPLYHDAGCTILQGEMECYTSKRECARRGAYPCELCKP